MEKRNAKKEAKQIAKDLKSAVAEHNAKPCEEKKVTMPLTNTLHKRFLTLSQRDQLGVTNFFNLHNAAHFVYDGLTEEAQAYVSYCIRLSSAADKVEKENSAQVS